jgi:hypothetical protein
MVTVVRNVSLTAGTRDYPHRRPLPRPDEGFAAYRVARRRSPIAPRSLMVGDAEPAHAETRGTTKREPGMSGSCGYSGRIFIRHSRMFAVVPAAVNHAAGFPTPVVPAVVFPAAGKASRTWVARIPDRPAAIRTSGIGITVIVAIMDRWSVCRRTRRRSDHAQDLRWRAGAAPITSWPGVDTTQ